MKPHALPGRTSKGVARLRFGPLLGAFLTTVLTLPAHADIVLPDEPLITSARVAPNILLVLDDSGSMAETFMPDSVPGTTTVNVAASAYTRNTIYYNPRTDYQPWLDATGVPMTGGTNYNSVFDHLTNASGSLNLFSGVRTFHVPIDLTNETAAYLGNGANYYRYQILTDGRVIRSQWLARSGTGPNYNNGPALNSGCTNTANTATWRNCTEATPTGRLPAAELANFAVWYSYHRTRMKVAKSGAGRAFSDLGNNVRVGFRTIWRANLAGNAITFDKPLLIGRNSGLFVDSGANNNRTVWYQRLYGTTAGGTTPLRDALNQAGRYYETDSSITGPYGPEAGLDQYTCRQNFTLLTTDGYRNEGSYPNAVGERDNVAGPTITGVASTYAYTPGRPYASAYGDTLADVAMRYWNTDLRLDLANNVPSTAANPAFWQHMVTFAISIGAAGTLNPETDLPGLTSGAIAWPNPSVNLTPETIDDLWHASVNGRGSFVLATDPTEFTNALRTSLAAIIERTGSASNVAANSTSVNAGTRLFQANYVSGLWTGEVFSYPIVGGVTSATPSWRASTGIPTFSTREVFTSTGAAGAVFPTAAQQLALTRTGAPINYPVSGADNVAYFKGSDALEMRNGGNLRNRTGRLGDIVNSSPAYVSDTDTVYVGSNDGMMHAINAASGAELFSYVPNGINWADLNTLSRPDYIHKHFVDGPIVVSDRKQTPGRNILVGALGRGGKGLYALDVSDPAGFSESGYLWEETGSDPDMGLVQSEPIIAKLNNGATAVIVSNGVNSTNGYSALFVYDLATGALIKKISTGVSATGSNGLAAPTGWDFDGNGTLDYVYAGDMAGRVWKFDLSAAATASWNIAGGSAMFAATDSTGASQPITGAVSVAMHPKTYQTWVFFGTGRLLTAGDVENKAVQSIYGLVDDGVSPIRNGASANLTARSIAYTGTFGGRPVRAFEQNSPLPASSKGWYVDLMSPSPALPEGERVVRNADVIGDVISVPSVIPTKDACDPGGKGYLNTFDAFSGTSTRTPFIDANESGGFADDVVTLPNGTVLPIGSIDLGVGMISQPRYFGGAAPPPVCVTGSDGTIRCRNYDDPRNTGRVSWREVKRN